MTEDAAPGFRRLSHEARKHFLDAFRGARAEVLRDSEAFSEVLFSLERLGAYITRTQGTLGDYRDAIRDELFGKADASEYHRVYRVVNEARNHALHQGAAARHLAQNCVSLALLLETCLSEGFVRVSDLMVNHPVCASLWQPLASIRQMMLAESFSFLPFGGSDQPIGLISDAAVARFLRRPDGSLDSVRLSMSLDDARRSGLQTLEPKTLRPHETIARAMKKMDADPAVIVGPKNQIVGILTYFDLL